ncbi:MAG: CYTH domain-containing protein [Cyanobium sp.]|nr:CYTH domain-containing protein [Cyanobium sp.]
MALEIERRFLVGGDGWRAHVHERQQMQQGYLTDRADGLTLRVRISECRHRQPSARLTLKAPAAAGSAAGPEGLVRQEFEYPIPLDDARALLALTDRQLGKRRYLLGLDGGDWVVDVFAGRNAPLVIAEVELDRPDRPITPPAWCALELTGRHEFSNAALAVRPFRHWPAAQREPFLPVLQWLDEGGGGDGNP